MPDVISRKEARSAGLKRYFTGTPCSKGHVSERTTGNADCVECNRLRSLVGDDPIRSLQKRDKNLRERYGMSVSDHVRMMSEQDNRCASCGNLDKELIVDHCHSTGAVRGLVCYKCNNILGLAKDNPHFLQCAIDYLLKN